jgi:branched-subunit amino acid transport protein
MNGAWAVIAGLAVSTFAIKAAGPLLLGERALPRWAFAVLALIAPALLAALTAVETFGAAHGTLSVDARAAGLLAAGTAIALRAPLVVTIGAAAVVAAAIRAVS